MFVVIIFTNYNDKFQISNIDFPFKLFISVNFL